ncbi:MAG: aminotransferase class V-fold PLP-dependent enzyme, partial [Firmicutes bacterium]|nr:aminotransferase class V-fold PLP-dependent enzyme [Bacillota bacterium]
LEVSVENLPDWERVGRLRDDIADHIIKNIGCAHINGSMTSRHPGNLSVSFDGVEGESLMLTLDSRGVCVSTGSACSSGAAEPSHVITALSDDKREALTRAKGSVRITLSHPTTKEDAEYIKECLTTCVASLRQITL